MKSIKHGFTLVEMLVVLGLLATIMAALTTSLSRAQTRTRIAKAESDVKIIHQAILGYENFDRNHKLPTMINRDADMGSIGFLIGNGGSAESGGKIPGILRAALTSGGKITDPWNTPYKITIKQSGAQVKLSQGSSALQTGFYYPNFYRLSLEERQ